MSALGAKATRRHTRDNDLVQLALGIISASTTSAAVCSSPSTSWSGSPCIRAPGCVPYSLQSHWVNY